MIKKRKPQPRCTCGHARSQHWTMRHKGDPFIWGTCGYCYSGCEKFEQDNLATLERLYEFKKNTLNLSLPLRSQ